MKIITPNNEFTELKNLIGNPKSYSIFLAGTIDNGNSYDWQKDLIDKIIDLEQLNNVYLNIFNPRRSNWNANPTKEDLEYQIKWEQEHLDKADIICMVLSDNSKSPITLLEMGLYANSGKLIVFCTNKFYRYDNVRLTCEKYLIPLVQSTKTEDIYNELKMILK